MRLSDQQITLSQLEGHLWESANILRGPVDAADFKTYIFPLLFFKRICDVWDEEYQEIVDETGDEQLAWFPESHRFQIPEDCHWNDVRTKASNVGTALQRAMREIEKANPDTLYGVFGDAQWSNKERLSDALLKDLIEHFSKLPFGNKNVNSDLLGDAYEYLIKKFADATNKKAGEFYTPRSVVRLMIDMLDPQEAETIYDPACGTGGMLLAAVQHVKEHAWRREAAVGQAVRAREEPHHLIHRADEPVPPRHRGLPGGARRHAAQPGLLRGRSAGHVRLRHRQSAVLAGKVGRGPVVERSLRPQLCRSAALVQR
jgi:type I restriction-modification system DNA methylase subunit